jgi:hypothetical protein
VTLVILNPSLLRDVEGITADALVATVSMTPSNRAYCTTVHVDLSARRGPRICLYSEVHTSPRVSDEVVTAVDAFNADPAGEWRRIVREALDAEEEILAEDKDHLDEKAADIQKTRTRLLGIGA